MPDVSAAAARSRTQSIAIFALVGLAYFGVSKLGLAFASAVASAVWPPAGLAIASVFLFGRRVAPAIVVAAFCANLSEGTNALAALGIALGNGISYSLAAELIARAGFDVGLRRVRDVLAFALLGAGLATMLNATIGTGALWAAHIKHSGQLWEAWRIWWLGDLTGTLLIAPAIFVAAAALRRGVSVRNPPRLAEASLVLAAIFGITLLVLRTEVTLAFPVFPLIVLAAIRFGQAGAIAAAIIVSGLGVGFTTHDMGPFVGGDDDAALLRAQVFVGLAAMTGLLVAAMRSEWERAEDALVRLAESEGALAVAEERFRTLVESAPDAMILVDESGAIVLVNNRTLALFGYPRDALIGQPSATLLPAPGFAKRADGGEFPVEVTSSPLRTTDGVLVSHAIRDITERRLAEQRLEHQALHDPLTDLPNRVLFLDRLEHALARADRAGSGLAVYFCDIDDFKSVNDSLGHEAGDELLVALPPRIRQALRPADTISRFGGDEFVILCEDLESAAEAIRIASRITDAFASPFALREREHFVTTSVGVVFVDSGGASAPEILRDADAAMYRAKAGGRARFELFDARMRAQLVRRLQVEAELRRAIGAGELRLHYQPMLALDGTLVGAEALVRWAHPERGLLMPAEFIEVAEDTGLVLPLGAWVIGEACRQAAAWDGLRVSINLSPHQVTRSNVAATLADALEETGVDPARIELEITETVLLDDSESTAGVLRELKQLGVRLVLDDFGTGYSSLSHLKRHPIDALKIDREFIDGIGDEGHDTAIVAAVLSMARALRVDVVAEGVETIDQLAWLREHGCDFAQGYLFSPPVEAARVGEAVRDWGGDQTVSA